MLSGLLGQGLHQPVRCGVHHGPTADACMIAASAALAAASARWEPARRSCAAAGDNARRCSVSRHSMTTAACLWRQHAQACCRRSCSACHPDTLFKVAEVSSLKVRRGLSTPSSPEARWICSVPERDWMMQIVQQSHRLPVLRCNKVWQSSSPQSESASAQCCASRVRHVSSPEDYIGPLFAQMDHLLTAPLSSHFVTLLSLCAPTKVY